MELVGLSMKIVDYFFFKIHFPYCSVSHGGNIFCPGLGVPREMDGFMQWFQNTAPDGSNPLPALTRAGMAHLYFVCIHPLKDGNGRIGRAIAEKALAQSFGQPTLIALSRTIQKHKKAYYDTLEHNNKGIEITDWLVYFSKTILQAQLRTQSLMIL